MSPSTYYSPAELEAFDSSGRVISTSLAVGLLTAKIAFLGFSCINPFMAILIKNILVLEFCSVLIMLNLKFPLQIRRLLA
jgi:hypothetical protein